ncbi:MAG: C39 family peptidase [Candidatus Bathyarchaeia archaeon]
MLEVPHFGQATDHHCVPTCQKMVIEYARQTLGVDCPVLSIKKIARITRIDRDGVVPEYAEKVNELLRRTKPPMKFQTQFGAEFNDITNELKENRPVIALINTREPPDELVHAVIIVDFVPNRIWYHDPDEDEKHAVKALEVGVFMSMWGWKNRLIKLLISKQQQTTIGDYNKQDQMEDDQE